LKVTLQKNRLVSSILVCWLTLSSCAMADTTLYLAGSDKNSSEYQQFAQNHPELTIHTETNLFLSTNEIISAFLTGEFPYDTFAMTSSSFDFCQMMEKGYCSPLDSSLLDCELEKMHSPIRQMLIYQGQLYGAPFHCYVGYYTYRPDAWEAAGLSREDVPSSFEEFLDFLEYWVERIRETPEDDISVSNLFDGEQYGEHSYISYLVDRLVENHIMQCNYAGEPLRFNTPVFRNLLERCQEIGKALYLFEPIQKGSMSLFEDLYGMRELKYLVPLRLTTDQPILIKSTLYVSFLNARSQHPQLATEYLENCVSCMAPEIGAYLYRDAQPVEDPAYVQMMDARRLEIEALEERMTDEIDPLEKNMLREQITNLKEQWEAMAKSEERYLISESDLKIYREYGDSLYFQPPSIFDPSTEEGQNAKQLRNQFSMGYLTVDQFVDQLDGLAWILEMEEQ